ncbi:hypothetical protein ACS0Y6_34775, partial [Burkholderia gladioli]|uniref:hypothetical protein n=1 Tax=Burkholderia gladioli TaxID=28095 RepID=UPI003F7B189D
MPILRDLPRPAAGDDSTAMPVPARRVGRAKGGFGRASRATAGARRPMRIRHHGDDAQGVARAARRRHHARG